MRPKQVIYWPDLVSRSRKEEEEEGNTNKVWNGALCTVCGRFMHLMSAVLNWRLYQMFLLCVNLGTMLNMWHCNNKRSCGACLLDSLFLYRKVERFAMPRNRKRSCIVRYFYGSCERIGLMGTSCMCFRPKQVNRFRWNLVLGIYTYSCWESLILVRICPMSTSTLHGNKIYLLLKSNASYKNWYIPHLVEVVKTWRTIWKQETIKYKIVASHK